MRRQQKGSECFQNDNQPKQKGQGQEKTGKRKKYI
jgi:hypothetical protein